MPSRASLHRVYELLRLTGTGDSLDWFRVSEIRVGRGTG